MIITHYAIANNADRCYSTTEIKTEEDLVPPGAKAGTVPSDIEQATGLERLELVGKMQGIDIFDIRPLDASRKGTLPYASYESFGGLHACAFN